MGFLSNKNLCGPCLQYLYLGPRGPLRLGYTGLVELLLLVEIIQMSEFYIKILKY